MSVVEGNNVCVYTCVPVYTCILTVIAKPMFFFYLIFTTSPHAINITATAVPLIDNSLYYVWPYT